MEAVNAKTDWKRGLSEREILMVRQFGDHLLRMAAEQSARVDAGGCVLTAGVPDMLVADGGAEKRGAGRRRGSGVRKIRRRPSEATERTPEVGSFSTTNLN